MVEAVLSKVRRGCAKYRKAGSGGEGAICDSSRRHSECDADLVVGGDLAPQCVASTVEQRYALDLMSPSSGARATSVAA